VPGGRRHQLVLTWIAFLAVAAAVVCASHPPADHHNAMHLPLCIDAGSAAIQKSDTAMFFADRAGFLPRAKHRSAVVPHAAVCALLYGSLDDWAPQPSQTPHKNSVNFPHLLFTVLHL
jgi:hypothetical protein